MRLFLLVAVLFALVAPARAEIGWVTLTTDAGELVTALMGRPEGAGPFPAVIYNHGTEVRQDGLSEGGDGTDVMGFVEALVGEGFVALAPIRTTENTTAVMVRGLPSGSAEEWSAVIEGGLRTTAAARTFLADQPGVEARSIGLLGFSEGGNIGLWSLIGTGIGEGGYRAAVLLSPAAIITSPTYRLHAAATAENLARVKVPVFLAMARDDLPPIRTVATEQLIPTLAAANPGFVHRTDYPGQHRIFWAVRNDYWDDVAAFLRQHLR